MRTHKNRLFALGGAFAASAVVLSGIGSIERPAQAKHEGPPNILVILADDERASALAAQTKTVKWMGERGTTYSRAYTPVPLCCPARASLFTGRHVQNHHVTSNHASGRLDQTTTMQRYLSEAGYKTRLVGKFLNGWDVNTPPPYFDQWALGKIGAKSLDENYYGGIWNVNGNVREVKKYSTSFVRDKTVAFIEQMENDDEKPWFLYAAPIAPHSPALPQRIYRDAPVTRWTPNEAVLEKDRSDKPKWVRQTSNPMERAEQRRKRQLRTLLSLDDLVDEVMLSLRETGEANDTLVFVASDNGYLLREHGLMAKKYPYTASIRVPLLVRWPGHVAAGVTDTSLASLVDIAPTALQAAGITAPAEEPMDGRSLFDPGERDHVYTQLPGHNKNDPMPSWRSIRSHKMQFIEYYDRDMNVVDREYYNLIKDPWQLRNLLGDGNPRNNPKVRPLSATIANDSKCAGPTCP